MNKSELITKIATQNNISKAKADKILSSTIETICKSVKKGDDVRLIGFGTFSKNKRKARNGRNPQTGKKIKIPSAWYPKFRPGSDFKKLLK